MPSEKNSMIGASISSKFMANRVIHRSRKVPQSNRPLPIRDGLNPTRARLPEDAAPTRADELLARLIRTQRHRHPEDGEAALLRRFAAGEVVLRSGAPLAPDSLVQPGWDVWFYRMPAPERPVPHQIRVIHRDEDLLVVDKPPFLATMPRGRHITETVTVRLRRETGIQDLTPAHRLDRLTSGVLVFTVRPEIRGAYQRLFADRAVTKTYEAIARHDAALAHHSPLAWASRMEKTPGEIQGHIVDGEPNAFTTLADVVPLTDPEQTAVEAIHGPLPRQARYLLRPETGRTHQLRLHMWEAGVPILGDPVYPRIHAEDEEDMAVPMHLIARELAFTDPLTGEPRVFTAPRERAVQ